MKYVRPTYSVAIYEPKGTKYIVKKYNTDKSEKSNIVTSLSLSEPEGQLAQKATITMFNQKIEGHGYPSNLFPVKSRVFIYAINGGRDDDKGEEVFRGIIWDSQLKNSANGSEITFTCYDNLIYLMNSEICEYFSKGKSSKTIVETLCKKWGIKVNYDYSTITHPKLLSGTLADVLISDVLDKIKVKSGSKYVIRSIKDVMHVIAQGTNKPVYKISRGENGIMLDWGRDITMDGMITKVVITGKTDDNDKTKIEATVSKNTKDYGTLQKVISKDEDTKLSTVKSEAKTILEKNATPKKTYDINAMDVPWIRKGDRVSVEFNEGTFHACIVNEITHNCDDSTMNMVVRRLGTDKK